MPEKPNDIVVIMTDVIDDDKNTPKNDLRLLQWCFSLIVLNLIVIFWIVTYYQWRTAELLKASHKTWKERNPGLVPIIQGYEHDITPEQRQLFNTFSGELIERFQVHNELLRIMQENGGILIIPEVLPEEMKEWDELIPPEEINGEKPNFQNIWWNNDV